MDVAAVTSLMTVTEGAKRPLTFHRAFDMTREPLAALDTIAELGFSRILTSGQEKTAHEGRYVTTN